MPVSKRHTVPSLSKSMPSVFLLNTQGQIMNNEGLRQTTRNGPNSVLAAPAKFSNEMTDGPTNFGKS